MAYSSMSPNATALLAEARRLLPLAGEAWVTPPVTAADAGLETVVNTLAHCARITTAARLELLALDSVFERSRRLPSSAGTQGSGLGLALVAAVMRLHGATLELDDGRPGLVVRLWLRRG